LVMSLRLTTAHENGGAPAIFMVDPKRRGRPFWAASLHVANMGSLLVGGGGNASAIAKRGHRQVDDLADLSPGGVVARPELQAPRPAIIPGDDAVRVGRLDVPIERVGVGYVPERRSPRRGDVPVLGQHD